MKAPSKHITMLVANISIPSKGKWIAKPILLPTPKHNIQVADPNENQNMASNMPFVFLKSSYKMAKLGATRPAKNKVNII